MPLIWNAITEAPDTDPYGSQKLFAVIWLMVLIVIVYSPFVVASTQP